MSYCPSGGSKQGWISPFTWNKMFNNLSASALATAAAPTATYSSTLVIDATIGNPALGRRPATSAICTRSIATRR